MSEPSLKDKTAKGLLWGGISNGAQQLLNLVFGIFLARLLDDADYGMVGMLSIFSLIAASLQESGFTQALANKHEISHKDYNAVFWFCSGFSLLLYIILFFCAPLIAEFYNNAKLIPLARYSFIGFFLSSLGIAQSAYLFRNLMVKQRALAAVIGLTVSGIIGILLAYNGFSYWGIATQSLIYVITVNGCYWFFSPWRPSLHIDFRPLKGMVGFSSKLLCTNIFNHLNNNLFSIILGRYYSEREVGQFNQANKWNYMGHSLISGMVGSVAQPMFAQITGDSELQQRAFHKMLRFTAFISFPAMFGLSLIAPELIIITITDKWLPSAYILQILAVGGAFIPIATLYSNLIISRGKSNVYMWNTVTLGIIQLCTMFLLSSFGIYTMLVVYVSINIFWLSVWHYFVYRETGLCILKALKDIFPFFAVSVLVMAGTYFATRNICNVYLSVIAKISMAASLYILLMWLGGSSTFRESIGYLTKKRKTV